MARGGRVDRGSFARWLSTHEGAEAVAEVAGTLPFSLFGRARAARRRLWREFTAALVTSEIASVLADAPEAYGRALADLAYASELPRVTAGVRRVVLVPRALVAGRARSALSSRLGRCLSFARMPLALRPFLLEQMLRELDAAVCAARPSPRRPVAASGEWVCVGVDTRFGWVDQIWSGPGWAGHFVVYERPPAFSRADRKNLERAVAELQSGIQTFSRRRRQDVAHAAARA